MRATSPGFPGDTAESIIRDIEMIKKELPVDLLEFFYLTPLPGSEDHKKMHEAGAPMDEDLNKYDLNHVTRAPAHVAARSGSAPTGTRGSVLHAEHVETVLRRAMVTGTSRGKALFLITWFKG